MAQVIRTEAISRTLQQSMQGLINRITDEECEQAAKNVRRRIVEESMRLTVEMKLLARMDTQNTEIVIVVNEAAPAAKETA